MTWLILKVSIIAVLLFISATVFASNENRDTDHKEISVSEVRLSEDIFRHRILNFAKDTTKIELHIDRYWEGNRIINRSERFIIKRWPVFIRSYKMGRPKDR